MAGTIAFLRSLVGVAEEVFVLLLLFRGDAFLLGGVFDRLDLLGIEHVHGTVGTHHGNLRRRPGIVEVSPQLLAAHHDVCTAVGLAQGHGHLRNGGLAIGIEQLGTVGDDGAVFLLRSAQEARHIHQGDQRNVEGVAEAHETGGFARGVDIQHAGQHFGLIGHHAHAASVHVGEADDDVAGELAVYFEELAVVHDTIDNIVHIVRLVRVVGNDTGSAVGTTGASSMLFCGR